jgi:hypothetical protein
LAYAYDPVTFLPIWKITVELAVVLVVKEKEMFLEGRNVGDAGLVSLPIICGTARTGKETAAKERPKVKEKMPKTTSNADNFTCENPA